MASPRAPGGTTFPTTGAARTAARRNPISRWWRSRARDGGLGERSDGKRSWASEATGRDPGRAKRREEILGERSDGKRSWASEATGRDSVARVTRPRDFGTRVGVPPARTAGGERQGSRSAQRIPYAEASRVLLRDSILDGMRELLLSRDWSSITLSDVARAAGISRQTIYNEFGSRQG